MMKASYLFVALTIMLLGVSALSAAYSTLFNESFDVSSPPAGWSIAGYVGTSHTTVGTAKTNADLFKNNGGANYLRLTENTAYNRAWAYNTANKFDVMGKWKITAEVRIGKTHNGTEVVDGADGMCFVFAEAASVETGGVFDPSKVTGGYGEFEGAPRGGLPNTPVNGALGYHAGFIGFSLEFDHYNNTSELYREYIHWVDLNDWQHSGLGMNMDGDTGFYYNDGWQRVQVEADAGQLTFSYNWNGSTYDDSFTMDTLNPPNANCDDLSSFDAYIGISSSTGGQTAFHEIRMFKMETDEATLPVEMSSFTAIVNSENYAALQWITQSETNLSGYNIYRGTSGEFSAALNLNVFIPAANTSQSTTYSFVDTETFETGTYYYWLQSIELDGATELFGPTTILITSQGPSNPDTPTVPGINDVYPNPFNPSTTISFGVTTDSHTKLVIYNSRGQEVRTLTDRHYTQGNYKLTWDGKNDLGQACASGIYTMRMVSGKEISNRKLVLMK